jgi:3'-phosphoadenosine 5'-phosphosulfate sulfotransferase (PAPS reductase)/FAD synthetase
MNLDETKKIPIEKSKIPLAHLHDGKVFIMQKDLARYKDAIEKNDAPAQASLMEFMKTENKPSGSGEEIEAEESELETIIEEKASEPEEETEEGEEKSGKGRLTQKREFEAQYLKELETVTPKTFEVPAWLKPYENYPYTDAFTLTSKRGAIPINIKLYGKFNGKPFKKEDITRANIDQILCIHDASHSVALFLTHKDDPKTVALHSLVPFVFPTSLPYTLYYSQKYEYPLITTEWGIPVREMLHKNLLMKTAHGPQGGRWCTDRYKIKASKMFYEQMGLKGITQLKGITKWQSNKRNKMYQGHAIDLVSSEALLKRIKDKEDKPEDYEKFFFVYQKLPIFDMTNEAIDKLIVKHGIKRNPPEELTSYKLFDWSESEIVQEHAHGCILCPFRNKMWYYYLKYQYPNLYDLCNQWRKWASEKRVEAGGTEYFYFFNPKTNKGEKIMD